jgi:hypothetical protein
MNAERALFGDADRLHDGAEIVARLLHEAGKLIRWRPVTP